MKEAAKEKQNQSQLDVYFSRPPRPMGPWTSHIWRNDPRHLAFMLARYKFVAKMLEGMKSAIEVGCGDAFGTPIVAQTVKRVHCIDFESNLFEDNQARNERENITFEILDICNQIPKDKFEAAYSMDVIEHVPAAIEERLMTNVCAALLQHSVFIMGTPNITASQYASPASMEGHINLKGGHELKTLMGKYFHNVFLFSMNDEVVHTGYFPMSHYLIAMGVGKKG
ncbi:MAG: class I SAM-dependent methyltransferase [Fibrobacterota bacterium]|nr:class I SAM-dependent methyltransferase [Fibrobacterota bacterium]